MKKTQRFFMAIATVVCLVCLLVSCSPKEPPLRVGTIVWPGSEPFYLARDLGYYKNTPIRLVDYPSGSEVLRAYRNGDLEAAALTLDEVFLLTTTNPDVRVVLITDTSYGADVILGKPEIKNLQGLKGRRVGVESTALGAFVLTRALEKVDMLPKDVKIISLEVSEHEQAFKKGIVDAVVTFDPVRSKLLATGAKILFDSRQLPREIVDVLAIREEGLKTQPNSLQALVNGWFKALNYLHTQPQDAAARMAPREGLTPEQFLESLKGLQIPDAQENQKLLGKTDMTLLNGAKGLAKVMLGKKLIKKAIDPAPLLEDKFVKNVKL